MEKSSVFVEICRGAAGWFDIVFYLPCGERQVFGSVFSDSSVAEAFAERINRLGLSALHIADVLEDALP